MNDDVQVKVTHVTNIRVSMNTLSINEDGQEEVIPRTRVMKIPVTDDQDVIDEQVKIAVDAIREDERREAEGRN